MKSPKRVIIAFCVRFSICESLHSSVTSAGIGEQYMEYGDNMIANLRARGLNIARSIFKKTHITENNAQVQGSVQVRAKSSMSPGHLTIVLRIPDIACTRMLVWQSQSVTATEQMTVILSVPSISTLRPIVRFHCLPALAMRRRRRSPSTVRRLAAVCDKAVELAAFRVAVEAPEKNEWMLYIS